ncbi:MAG: RDD family protein [Planctomycetes bacterium]|nr:RDD family protein [Planctomycetota bacterium]
MTSRWPKAVSLGFAVALLQIGAFVAIGLWAWQAMVSLAQGRMKFALTVYAHEFRGELIIPECELMQRGTMLQSGGAISLLAVNLKTGVSRQIPLPSVVMPLGIASDGERLWVVAPNEVLEFDGTQVITIRPNRKVGVAVGDPFLYEGQLALIERDSLGIDRLTVLNDGQWQDRGRIALPGPGRKWVLDAVTGNSILAPRDSSLPVGFAGACRIQVVSHQGEYHLFQFDGMTTKPTVSYHAGFAFVDQPEDDEPLSALVAENQAAEATGWVLLDLDYSTGFPNVAYADQGFILCNKNGIWKLPLSGLKSSPCQPERFTTVELGEDEQLRVVPSPATPTHVLACPLVDDVKVLQLQDGQLHTRPYTVAGMGRPIQRWMLNILFRVFIVLLTGTLILIVAANRMQREPIYSFGHENVRLASIIRRSLARSVDLVLLFGPIFIQAWSLLWKTSFETLMRSLEDPTGLTRLTPTALWLAGAWLTLVVSHWLWGTSPGKWLFGLRVVRTSLRPCGLLSSLARELLFWVDTSQLLSAIPGVACMIGTENRQRIGDLIAGTLVIDTSSCPAQ